MKIYESANQLPLVKYGSRFYHVVGIRPQSRFNFKEQSGLYYDLRRLNAVPGCLPDYIGIPATAVKVHVEEEEPEIVVSTQYGAAMRLALVK